MATKVEERPFVSVVLAVRNEAASIRDCLEGILAQDYPGHRFDIVVADGESDDGTREIVKELAKTHPKIVLIDNPGRIVSTGLNRAMARARGDVIVRMDGHTTFASDYVSRCVETLQRTGADNVGGPARTAPDPDRPWAVAIAAAYHSRFSVGGARFHEAEHEGPVDTVPYGCWPRATFEKFGLFDEGLVRNQDDEHNLRIVRGGGVVYQCPSIRSWYRTRESLRALFTQYSQYGYWKVRVIQKHRLPASPRHLVPAAFLCGVAGGAAVAPLSQVLLGIYVVALGFYVALSLGYSAAAARQSGWRLLPRLPVVFFVYHVAYGWGFVRGLPDFLLLRRGGRASMERLSRPASVRSSL